jgi:hypothetical protein
VFVNVFVLVVVDGVGLLPDDLLAFLPADRRISISCSRVPVLVPDLPQPTWGLPADKARTSLPWQLLLVPALALLGALVTAAASFRCLRLSLLLEISYALARLRRVSGSATAAEVAEVAEVAEAVVVEQAIWGFTCVRD